MDEDTKKCPYCAETIKAEAVLCRYCRSDLRSGAPAGPAAPEAAAAPEVKARSGVADGVKIGFGMFIVLPIIIVAGVLLLVVIIGSFNRGSSSSPSSSSYESYRPALSEAQIKARDQLVDKHNRGVAFAQSQKAHVAADCDPLMDADERAACVA